MRKTESSAIGAVSGPSLYDPAFVRALFDEMAATYGIVNLLSSFGFCVRWRNQCVQAARLEAGMVVYDLMSGMGECWPAIRRRVGPGGRIVGVDISRSMCDEARKRVSVFAHRSGSPPCDVIEADVLECDLPRDQADAVVACFAVKTLDPAQQHRFAQRVADLLRSGGRFSILEISIPPFAPLRVPYRFYLNAVVPHIGRLLLGNPDNYRYLGRYTDAFGNVAPLCGAFAAAGLATECRSYFFGCATGLTGSKM